jgi:hypothetical protein
MQISEETLYKVAGRVWHIALFAGSLYVMANPQYAWAIPLIQALGQTSNSPQ